MEYCNFNFFFNNFTPPTFEDLLLWHKCPENDFFMLNLSNYVKLISTHTLNAFLFILCKYGKTKVIILSKNTIFYHFFGKLVVII
jgi:hypothetical protein